MKAARVVVLGVALASGVAAAYFMAGSKPEPAPTRVVQAPPPAPAEAVLVAAHDITFGSLLTDADVRWQPWTNKDIPPGAFGRVEQPNAVENVRNHIVRANVDAGEPLIADRLQKRNGSGFLAAVLRPGMRAVAIDLSDQGKSAAGGFILPNDRVDVIRTYHPEGTPGSFASETILANIRVLAIGQSVQEKAGERSVIGSTATLETNAEQAEKLILAQRTGQLTLSLRSMSDVDEAAPVEQPVTMTVIRSGNASQARVK